MKHAIVATVSLAILALSSACDLRYGQANDYAATDQLCGGIPSEACPQQ